MKKSNPTIKAQILRSAFYLLLLLGICAIPFALAQWSFDGRTASATSSKQIQRTLTFAGRVAYQGALEQVYWRHRIWPKEHLRPKPSLDEAISAKQIEQKAEDYVRDSQALEAYGKSRSLPGSCKPKWSGWPDTQNNRKSCGNCLRLLGTIPLLSLSAWPGRVNRTLVRRVIRQ